MILNFKKNKIILFILFGLICLGVFWLMSNNKIKEGDSNFEEMTNEDLQAMGFEL